MDRQNKKSNHGLFVINIVKNICDKYGLFVGNEIKNYNYFLTFVYSSYI